MDLNQRSVWQPPLVCREALYILVFFLESTIKTNE